MSVAGVTRVHVNESCSCRSDTDDDAAPGPIHAGDLSLNSAAAAVVEVGTVTPVEDFEALLKDGQQLMPGKLKLANGCIRLVELKGIFPSV